VVLVVWCGVLFGFGGIVDTLRRAEESIAADVGKGEDWFGWAAIVSALIRSSPPSRKVDV
jgi:hypothetical protein